MPIYLSPIAERKGDDRQRLFGNEQNKIGFRETKDDIIEGNFSVGFLNKTSGTPAHLRKIQTKYTKE